MQTIDLVPNYSVNGISALYGVFTAPSYVQTIYNVYYGVDQLLHTHTGTGSAAIYTAWIHMMSASGMVTVTVSKQGTYWPTRVTEILTQDFVTSISGSQTQIPMSFNLGNGGIIGCIKTAINTTQAGQWEISKTNDKALTITPSSLRQDDHSVGLSINSDSSIIKFNGNEIVNVGTDQTINGTKIFNGVFQVNPSGTNYNEGIRIAKASNGLSQIQFGVDPAQYSGQIQGQ
ncbi:MAG: hypothetical protein EZS28_052958, partial [Streblomastix strix]